MGPLGKNEVHVCRCKCKWAVDTKCSNPRCRKSMIGKDLSLDDADVKTIPPVTESSKEAD